MNMIGHLIHWMSNSSVQVQAQGTITITIAFKECV